MKKSTSSKVRRQPNGHHQLRAQHGARIRRSSFLAFHDEVTDLADLLNSLEVRAAGQLL